jgi:AGZA family xanthine/uracil permease-like MFS transporter
MRANRSHSFRYKWFAIGDLNAFFALMFDNVANLALFGLLLTGIFKIPADIVYTKMFPGTAMGVLIGDAIYTWLAFRLARRMQNANVTAMPLGLDSPSTVGIALMVIGPAFQAALRSTPNPTPQQLHDAGIVAWQVGMATLFLIGVVKLVFSFFGDWVARMVPEAGLLGSLAGVGITFLALVPLEHMFGLPIVGMIAFGIILYALVAKIKLPFNLPSVFLSVIIGAAIYYSLLATGAIPPHKIDFTMRLTPPVPTLGFLEGLRTALDYLPIAIPFGLLTVIGGINVTASARIAGDSYKTRSILLTEAVATLGAALCGGVAQSTPYIGHPAYKAMGGRAGYTLATGLFVGLGGVLGILGFMAELLPAAALAPIFIFVGLDIVEQSYHATPKRHAMAVTMAVIPAIPALAQMKLGPMIANIESFYATLKTQSAELASSMHSAFQYFEHAGQESWMAINAAGNGFILTAMIWGSFTAMLIDRRFRRACVFLLIGAVLTFFGAMHSVKVGGGMYLPWQLAMPQHGPNPYLLTAAYLILAAMIYGLSFTKEARAAALERDSISNSSGVS